MPARSTNFSDAIEEYEHHRRAMQVRPGSIGNEVRMLRAMLAHVGNIQMRNFKDRHVDDFFLARQPKIATSTWNHELSMARTFFNWCERRRYFGPDGNPIAHRKARSFVPRSRLRIPATEFPHLLDSARDPVDRIVVALGMFLLLRMSEVKPLRIGHVNLTTGEVAVAIQKTSQRDVMPISAELDTELRRYLTWYASVAGRPLHDDDYLVPARAKQLFGHPNPKVVVPDRPHDRPFRCVQATLRNAGYDVRDPDTGKSNGEGLHTLRRSSARAIFDQLVDGGYDGALRTVQAMLHHSTANMTEKYLSITLDIKKRDEMFKGKTMFAQPASNVVALAERRAE